MRDIARFTELLFADQSLNQLLISTDSETQSQEKVWLELVEAEVNVRTGDRDRAIELLLSITARPDIETRILLLSWVALRNLGVHPDPGSASESKGIVIQVPVNRGIDVLACYADGTARYVNHNGKIIVWDLPDVVISGLIRKLLDCSRPLHPNTSPSLVGRSFSEAVRVTVLTCSGNRSFETSIQSLALDQPINQLLAMEAELMAALIKRTEAMNQLMK